MELLILLFDFLGQLILELLCLVYFNNDLSNQPNLANSFIRYFFIGIIIGIISVILIPSQFIRLHTIPGLSMILVPILTGLSMKMWGIFRGKRGKDPIHLATFWGGAIFAFGTTLSRFILIYIILIN